MTNTSGSTLEENLSEENLDNTDTPETEAQDNVVNLGANKDDAQKALQDQLIRLQADFENFRKRVESEKADLYKYGAERTVASLLPVLDNLQRGSASLNENSDPKLLYQSFRMLYTQLMDSLSNQGLKKIEAVGQPFDPFFHEAVQNEPSDQPENTVILEHQAGYQLHERVIRPAMVVVSAGGGESADGNPFQQ